MRTSEKIDTLAAALAKAQGQMENPKATEEANIPGKDGKQGFSYRYVSLDGIIEGVRAALKEHDLSHTQETHTLPEGVAVTTRLMHASGQWIEYGPLIFANSGDPRQAGSALTYARRYALSAVLGIATSEDDDAAAAGGKGSGSRRRQQPVEPSQQQSAPARSESKPKPEAKPKPEDGSDEAPATRALWEEAAKIYGTRANVVAYYRDENKLTGAVNAKAITNAQMRDLIELGKELTKDGTVLSK